MATQTEPTGVILPEYIKIGGKDIAVWPEDQEVNKLSADPTILLTRFADMAGFNTAIIKRVLELEQDASFTHSMAIGGSKVRDVHRWGIPEADLLHARAERFFSLATSRTAPVTDQSWASVYRQYDYLSPHSHDKTIISLVYMLDVGDTDPDNSLSGRLSFADPRIDQCCNRQPECVTMEFSPDMSPVGTMLLFPSHLVHFVHTYTGRAANAQGGAGAAKHTDDIQGGISVAGDRKSGATVRERPRISIAWNID